MGALLLVGALLALGGFIGLALSTLPRAAFPAFLTIVAGVLLLAAAGLGRLVGVL